MPNLDFFSWYSCSCGRYLGAHHYFLFFSSSFFFLFSSFFFAVLQVVSSLASSQYIGVLIWNGLAVLLLHTSECEQVHAWAVMCSLLFQLATEFAIEICLPLLIPFMKHIRDYCIIPADVIQYDYIFLTYISYCGLELLWQIWKWKVFRYFFFYKFYRCNCYYKASPDSPQKRRAPTSTVKEEK